MIAVLTGDVIRSRTAQPQEWLVTLKEVLGHYGRSPKAWQIYRGDSFQLMISPGDALRAALHLKAGVKQHKGLDVRIAIGVGDRDFDAPKVNESNGEAYVFSGELYETLKKRKLAFRSEEIGTTEMFNLMFDLSTFIMDRWTSNVASIIKCALENPNSTQTELSNILNRTQSSISEAFKRGGYDELIQMNNFYEKQMAVI